MKTICILLVLMTAFTVEAFPENWERFIRESLEQSPSESKRRRRAGQRLIREKQERINRIDQELPELIKTAQYGRAESITKEALRLTIEIYPSGNLLVAERFIHLGMFYTQLGQPDKAEGALEWGLKIGSRFAGDDSVMLVEARRLLAGVYYDLGKYALAAAEAEKLLSVYVGKYGPRSPRAERVKEFLRETYRKIH